MAVRVEAGRIDARAKVQHAPPLRMPLCRCTLGREPTQGNTNQRRAGRGEEGSAAQDSGLWGSVHDGTPLLHLDICRADPTAAVGESSYHAGLVAPQLLDRR